MFWNMDTKCTDFLSFFSSLHVFLREVPHLSFLIYFIMLPDHVSAANLKLHTTCPRTQTMHQHTHLLNLSNPFPFLLKLTPSSPCTTPLSLFPLYHVVVPVNFTLRTTLHLMKVTVAGWKLLFFCNFQAYQLSVGLSAFLRYILPTFLSYLSIYCLVCLTEILS